MQKQRHLIYTKRAHEVQEAISVFLQLYAKFCVNATPIQSFWICNRTSAKHLDILRQTRMAKARLQHKTFWVSHGRTTDWATVMQKNDGCEVPTHDLLDRRPTCWTFEVTSTTIWRVIKSKMMEEKAKLNFEMVSLCYEKNKTVQIN